jgi:hypothetical protein
MEHEESTPGLDAMIPMDTSNQPLRQGEVQIAPQAEAVRTGRVNSSTLARRLVVAAAAVLVAEIGIGGWVFRHALLRALRPVEPPGVPPRSKWMAGTETFANNGKTRLPFEELSTGAQASPVVADKLAGTNTLVMLDRSGKDLRVELKAEQSEVPERLVGIAFFGSGRKPLMRSFALLGKEGPGLKATALLPMRSLRLHLVVDDCETYLIVLVPPEALSASDFGALRVAIRSDPSRFDDWKAWFASAEPRLVRDLRDLLADLLRS